MVRTLTDEFIPTRRQQCSTHRDDEDLDRRVHIRQDGNDPTPKINAQRLEISGTLKKARTLTDGFIPTRLQQCADWQLQEVCRGLLVGCRSTADGKRRASMIEWHTETGGIKRHAIHQQSRVQEVQCLCLEKAKRKIYRRPSSDGGTERAIANPLLRSCPDQQSPALCPPQYCQNPRPRICR